MSEDEATPFAMKATCSACGKELRTLVLQIVGNEIRAAVEPCLRCIKNGYRRVHSGGRYRLVISKAEAEEIGVTDGQATAAGEVLIDSTLSRGASRGWRGPGSRGRKP